MNKVNLMFVLLFLLPNFIFSQDIIDYSNVKTKSGEVKIPGNWEELNRVDDSGQTYLKNKDGVIIAIAQNPKNSYPFFKSNKSDFENVKLFYVWDSDYLKENKFKIQKIKENSKLEYIIWKYNDKKLDNVFLFGSIKDNFLNLLVYTNIWSEDEKIIFLENLYKLNK
ncbi:hypothetical protein [Flavobacterium hydatis]|uniref:Uncharacterized protein n=2 Tax=Flavobacterium hydatis TaxID=991 RepID=A0A086AH88_FLAHY|nr:hypothetical protein [Flavobacterium hydatis]KFF16052.1 hypothetical protein IW20_11950 [Flavobacterium hydatis]